MVALGSVSSRPLWEMLKLSLDVVEVVMDFLQIFFRIPRGANGCLDLLSPETVDDFETVLLLTQVITK